jgi:hypothetical protein
MNHCEVCGNGSGNHIVVIKDGKRHTFDSIECMIQALAPVCFHCGSRIIGHRAETQGRYCCVNCATKDWAPVAQARMYPGLAHVRFSDFPPIALDLE